jgi:hypothetical protein
MPSALCCSFMLFIQFILMGIDTEILLPAKDEPNMPTASSA